MGAPSPLAFDAPKKDNPIKPIPTPLRRSSKKRNNDFLRLINDLGKLGGKLSKKYPTRAAGGMKGGLVKGNSGGNHCPIGVRFIGQKKYHCLYPHSNYIRFDKLPVSQMLFHVNRLKNPTSYPFLHSRPKKCSIYHLPSIEIF